MLVKKVPRIPMISGLVEHLAIWPQNRLNYAAIYVFRSYEHQTYFNFERHIFQVHMDIKFTKYGHEKYPVKICYLTYDSLVAI